jgi:hypothetical protein
MENTILSEVCCNRLASLRSFRRAWRPARSTTGLSGLVGSVMAALAERRVSLGGSNRPDLRIGDQFYTALWAALAKADSGNHQL